MSEVVTDDLPVTEPVVEVVETNTDPIGLDAHIDAAFDAVRDEKGRFAPKEELAAETSKEPVKAATTATDPKAPEPAAVQPLEAPARWTEADKAKFATWPRDTQEAVIERHKAMEADYTRKSQDIAEFRKSAEPLVQAVQPYQQYLAELSKNIGINPPQMINAMLGTEYKLRTGTADQKVQALASLASEYGIDLAAMSRGEGTQPTPLIDNLRQTVTQLSQRLNHYEQSQQQQAELAQQRERQQVSAEITAFETAKNTDGTPKHPHYQRVKGVMAQIFGNGEAETLEQAYEAAVAPINEAIAAELGQRQKSADETNADAVAKARRASSPKVSGTQPNGAAKSGGLDALLDKNLSNAGYV